jgi:hypothetical protein
LSISIVCSMALAVKGGKAVTIVKIGKLGATPWRGGIALEKSA